MSLSVTTRTDILVHPVYQSIVGLSSSFEEAPSVSAKKRDLIFGDSPFDDFLFILYQKGLLDENFEIHPDAILPEVQEIGEAEVDALNHLLSKSLKFQIHLEKEDKDRIRKNLRTFVIKDEKELLLYPYLSNDDSVDIETTFSLLELFRQLMIDPERLSFSQYDQIKFIGGAVRKVLYGWLRKSVTLLGVADEDIPFNPFLTREASDIDFRYHPSITEVDRLNQLTQNFFASKFFPPTTDLDLRKRQSDFIREAGCSIVKIRKEKGIKNSPITVSSIGVGNPDRVDLAFATIDAISRHSLFSTDDLYLRIEGLVKRLIFKTHEVDPPPQSGSKNQIWRAVIACFGNLFHVDSPEKVNHNGWIRFLWAMTDQRRCPTPIKISSILFKAVRSGLEPIAGINPNKRLVEQIIKDLLHFHKSRHKKSHFALIAHTLNIFNALDEEKIDLADVSLIWEHIQTILPKEVKSCDLLSLIIRALKLDFNSLPLIMSVIRTAAILMANSKQNVSDELKVYLIDHEGQPVLQVVAQYALILSLDLEKTITIISTTLNDQNFELLALLDEIIKLFLVAPLDQLSTQIFRNKERIDSHLGLRLEESIKKMAYLLLTKAKSFPIFKQLGYQLLLSFTPFGNNSSLLLEHLPDVLCLKYIEHLEKVFANKGVFKKIYQLSGREHPFEGFISLEWAKCLVGTQDANLALVGAHVWQNAIVEPKHKKECGIKLMKSLLLIVPKTAFEIMRYLIENGGLSEKEEAQLFIEACGEPDNLKQTSQENYNDLEKIISKILGKKQGDKQLQEFPEKLAIFLRVFSSHKTVKMSRELLILATTKNVASLKSEDMAFAWLEMCKQADENSLGDSLELWKQALSLGVKLDQVLPIDSAVFLAELGDKLLMGRFRQNLRDQYFEILCEKRPSLITDSEKNAMLMKIREILPNNIQQAILLYLRHISISQFNQKDELPLFQQIFQSYQGQNSDDKCPLDMLMTLSKLAHALIKANKLAKEQSKGIKSEKKRVVVSSIQHSTNQFALKQELLWITHELIDRGENITAEKLLLEVSHSGSLDQESILSWFELCQTSLDSEKEGCVRAAILWAEAKTLGVWKHPFLGYEKGLLLVHICRALLENQKNFSIVRQLLNDAMSGEIQEFPKDSLDDLIQEYMENCLKEARSLEFYQQLESTFEGCLSSEIQFLLKYGQLKIHGKNRDQKKIILTLCVISKEDLSLNQRLMVIQLFEDYLNQIKNVSGESLKEFERLFKDSQFNQLFIGQSEKKLEIIFSVIKLIGENSSATARLHYLMNSLILNELDPINLSSSMALSIIRHFNEWIEVSSLSNKKPLKDLEKSLNGAMSYLMTIFIQEKHYFHLLNFLNKLSLYSVEIIYSQMMIRMLLIAAKELMETNLQIVHDAMLLVKHNRYLDPELLTEQDEVYRILIQNLLKEEYSSSHPKYSQYAKEWIEFLILKKSFLIGDVLLIKGWVSEFLKREDFPFIESLYLKILKGLAKENMELISPLTKEVVISYRLKDPLKAGKFFIENQCLFLSKDMESVVHMMGYHLLAFPTNDTIKLAWQIAQLADSNSKMLIKDIFDAFNKTPDLYFKLELPSILQLMMKKKIFKESAEPLRCWQKMIEAVVGTSHRDLFKLLKQILLTSLEEDPFIEEYRIKLIHFFLKKIKLLDNHNLSCINELLECQKYIPANLIDFYYVDQDINIEIVFFALRSDRLDDYVLVCDHLDRFFRKEPPNEFLLVFVQAVYAIAIQGTSHFVNEPKAIKGLKTVLRIIEIFFSNNFLDSSLLCDCSSYPDPSIQKAAFDILSAFLTNCKKPIEGFTDQLKRLYLTFIPTYQNLQLALGCLTNINMGFHLLDHVWLKKQLLLLKLKLAVSSPDIDIERLPVQNLANELPTLDLTPDEEGEYLELSFDYLLKNTVCKKSLLGTCNNVLILIHILSGNYESYRRIIENFLGHWKYIYENLEKSSKVNGISQVSEYLQPFLESVIHPVWGCLKGQRHVDYLILFLKRIVEFPPSSDLIQNFFFDYFVGIHLLYLIKFHQEKIDEILLLVEEFMFKKPYADGVYFASFNFTLEELFKALKDINGSTFPSLVFKMEVMLFQPVNTELIPREKQKALIFSMVDRFMTPSKFYSQSQHNKGDLLHTYCAIQMVGILCREGIVKGMDLTPCFEKFILAIKDYGRKTVFHGSDELNWVTLLQQVIFDHPLQMDIGLICKNLAAMICDVFLLSQDKPTLNEINNVLAFLDRAYREGYFNDRYSEFFEVVKQILPYYQHWILFCKSQALKEFFFKYNLKALMIKNDKVRFSKSEQEKRLLTFNSYLSLLLDLDQMKVMPSDKTVILTSEMHFALFHMIDEYEGFPKLLKEAKAILNKTSKKPIVTISDVVKI